MNIPVTSIIIDGQTSFVRNLKSLGIRSNFDRRLKIDENTFEGELNVDRIVLVNESRDQVDNWISTYGAHVGIPAQVQVGNVKIDYFIDLTQAPRFRGREVEVSIKRRKGTDAFFEWAQGATFEYLASQGVKFPTKKIAYVIIPEDHVAQGIALAISIFSMVQTAAQAIKDTADTAADFIAALDLSPSHAISAAAKLAAQIAYTAAIIIALIDLVKRLREIIYPKLRYFNYCTAKDLITTACAYKGYAFNSSLLDNIPGFSIIPVPLQKDKKSIFKFKQDQLTESFTKGYPTSFDSVSTVGQLFEALETQFNGETKSINGNVRFERWDYWKNLTAVQKNPFFNLNNREFEYTLNTDEAWTRYYIHYLLDGSDANTSDNFEPTDAEYGAQNTNQIAPDLNLVKGLVDVPVPFSLATRKNSLTWIEQIAEGLFAAIDGLTGGNSLSNVESRVGVMQISEQFFSVTKCAIIENSRLSVNNENILRASALWNNYHNINRIESNAYRVFENVPVSMSLNEFEQILENNYIDIDGVVSEILNVEYIPWNSKAIINYRYPDNYATGKITTFAVNV